MHIERIESPILKSEICNSLLRSLPFWFGIESAIMDYVKDVQDMETWGAFEGQDCIGFVSLHKHFPQSAELHIMAIRQQFHRKGIGHKLLQAAETYLRSEGFKFLQVKTLSPSRPNSEYDQTRNFYLKMGFIPLQEFKTLWNEDNPCLLLVKSLL